MASIIIPEVLTDEAKLSLMGSDARYEVAGDRDAEATALICAAGIKGKPAPPTVPKMFLASKCVFNCAYCGCRCSREDRQNYVNEPRTLAALALGESVRNGNGVFISSAIYKNADHTQEMLAETARVMREELHYRGYLHVKVMPGSDQKLIERTGRYADRLSVNIEVAKSEGYAMIAKQKNKSNILTPMRGISDAILEAKGEKRKFAVSQTTQLMAGSTGEDDRTIMTLSCALYDKYRLKRVYYTAFGYTHEAQGYEYLSRVETPFWRMARLYQADRLLQLYGFTPDDVTPPDAPYLEEALDPKAAWALRNLGLYPVEVNRADYDTLIRVPGIGVTFARRIIEARKHCVITHDVMRKMRIPLKRCVFFITCNGVYKGMGALDSQNLRGRLESGGNAGSGERQISISETLGDGAGGECF